jgi:hypothetical protein
MTEAEWLECTDPYRMLDFPRGKACGRKLRLFACGCCRQRVWPLLTDPRSRDAVEVAERYADGLVNYAALRGAWIAAGAVCAPAQAFSANGRAAAAAAFAAHRSHACARWAAGRVFSVAYYASAPDPEAHRAAERAAHLALVRCVFGNPFRPVPVPDAWWTWNGGTIRKVAQAVYDERVLPEGALDAGRLAILADALEEAGCTNADILGHLRGPGPHILGCHVMDRLLRLA